MFSMTAALIDGSTKESQDMMKGKCCDCEYESVCGGCRARAYETTGDYLVEEPLCSHTPKKAK